MAEEGKEEALFQRVESLGLRLEYDSGFLVVARSAPADQRRDDDDAEVEEAFLEQLGKHMKEISIFAVGKARGARGRDFVDRRVFIPSLNAFGTLKDCGEDGRVQVEYRRESFRNPDVDVVHSGSGSDLLVILDDERPAPASKTSFTWIVDERLRRRFERADEAGLRIEHDSGFTLVRVRMVDGAGRGLAEGIIRELGAKLGEISVLAAARARGERGADFVGRRVLVPAFYDAVGVIESSDSSGSVTVRYRDKHMKSEVTSHCRGNHLLIVPDQAAAKAASAEPDTETAFQRLMRRAFGG